MQNVRDGLYIMEQTFKDLRHSTNRVWSPRKTLVIAKMAIKTCCISVDGKRVMSIEQFKRWLRKFDADKDGKLSRKELEDAIPGGWFTRWKGKAVIRSADSNGNGFIDESEIDNLVEFAQKYLGVKILQF